MNDCLSCVYFKTCTNNPEWCHSWTPVVNDGNSNKKEEDDNGK